jgi:alpha-beta hydrolase superfamily lysophospholipase
MTDARNISVPADDLEQAMPRAAGAPVTFDGTIGLFTSPGAKASHSGLAVLFASPWGLEEICTRRFWRITAETLADHGIPSLRFDYPGTGDALDGSDTADGLASWSNSLVSAARQLKTLSGCERIAIIAQGLGAAVTLKAAGEIDGVEAIAFLAPVVSGRMYLRELSLWSKVVDDNLGLTPIEGTPKGVSIASLDMPASIAEEVRKLDLMKVDAAPAPHVLVVGRPDRPSDSAFAAHLRMIGTEVVELPFDGYEKLVSNPATAKMPIPVAEELAGWISELPVEPNSQKPPRRIALSPLRDADFEETPVRFGVNGHLSGVLCEPVEHRRGATVLFLSSAYDRHAGWGRTTAIMARKLARIGIASLRFDTAGVGDSPPVPGRPQQILYHSSQNADVSAAIDFLTARGPSPVVVTGRCSGAYLGFRAALADERIAGVCAVNAFAFRWRPGRSVEDAIVKGTRSLHDYGKRALKGDTLKRLAKGEIDVRAAGFNIVRGIGSHALNRFLHAFRHVLPEGRAVYSAFAKLQHRDVPVSLVYSEGDIGMRHFQFYLGGNAADMRRFGNVTVIVIPDADHNLTPDHARATYLDTVRKLALSVPRPKAKASETHHAVAAE